MNPSSTAAIPKEHEEKLPKYLSFNNLIFQQMIQSIVLFIEKISKEDIQEIAFLLHTMEILKLERLLWNSYLRSGTAKIEQHRQSISNITLNLWPSEMKLKMIEEKKISTTNINNIDHDTFIRYVYEKLNGMVDRINKYGKQLHIKKEYLKNNLLAEELEDYLMKYIQDHGLLFERMLNDKKIAIIEYNYKDRLLELEYDQLKPNPYQIEYFQKMTQLKQNHLTKQYDIATLKQRLLYHDLPETIQSLQLPALPTSYQTIVSEEKRQHILKQYEEILQRTQTDLVTLHIQIDEIKMQEIQLEFNTNFNQMKQHEQRSQLPYQLLLSPAMLYILEQRFQNINERFEFLFNIKKNYLEKKQQHFNSFQFKEFLNK